MGTAYFDIDGTLIKWGENPESLDGVLRMLDLVRSQGHQIYLTTRRGNAEWGPHHENWSEKATITLLDKLGIKYDKIIFDSSSPRVIINDEGAYALDRLRDAPWDDKEIRYLLTLLCS